MANPDMIITLLTLAGAVVLLVGGFLRNDMVAVLIILALMLSEVLTIPEALSGFSSTAMITIACMFVIGEAIINTGIASSVGNNILKYGGASEVKILAMLMCAVCMVGAFMSSAATAAIFIPITLAVAEKANLNPKRMLMPLSVAALISGMMTLVAATPNIVINNILREHGQAGLSLFSYTPFGLLIMILGILFMALFGQNMLAEKTDRPVRKKKTSIDDLLLHYHIDKSEYFMRIPPQSDLVGRTVAQMQLGALHHIILLAVQSGCGMKSAISPARPELVLQAGDLLMFIGNQAHADAFATAFALERQRYSLTSEQRKSFFQVVGLAEIMLNPDSDQIGKSLKEILFQSSFHCMVLGIRRKGDTLTEDIADRPLKFGDVLLICGSWDEILRIGKNREHYLLLTLPQDHKEVVPAPKKRYLALAIMLGMVTLISTGLLPPVAAILAATAALLLTGCVPIRSVYTVIEWPTLMLIAGILPLALALQKTGVVQLISTGFLSLFSNAGPLAILAGLFVITTILGLFMISTAVAVLITPIAIDISLSLGIPPQVSALTVALACSAAFVSPLGSTVNMLILEPGGYKISDFVKVGTPILLLSMLSTLFLVWVLYL